MIDFKGNLDDHLPLIKFVYNTVASRWLLMNLFMGEDANISFNSLKLVKLE